METTPTSTMAAAVESRMNRRMDFGTSAVRLSDRACMLEAGVVSVSAKLADGVRGAASVSPVASCVMASSVLARLG